MTTTGTGSAQLTLGHMPTPLLSCTPSRLAAFDCPRRYRFAYLDRPAPARGAPWAHNTVGATAHVALHRWWSLPVARRTPAEGERLVYAYWQDIGFQDAAQSARARASTAGWVADYLEHGDEHQVDPADEPVGAERTVGARTERLALSGRVDRIDERDGALVIVDYKTGRRAPTADDARASQPLALYVLAARRTLRSACTRVELHHLPTGTVAAAEHTDDSLARHLVRAERTADDICAATDTLAAGADPDAVFPTETGPACSWCDFRQQCPEGRAASPELASWAGLSDAFAEGADGAPGR